MSTLEFQFQANVSPDVQTELLAKLRSNLRLEHLGPIDPTSCHPQISRMCIAQSSIPSRIDQLKAELAKLPVENVEKPAERKLID